MELHEQAGYGQKKVRCVWSLAVSGGFVDRDEIRQGRP